MAGWPRRPPGIGCGCRQRLGTSLPLSSVWAGEPLAAGGSPGRAAAGAAHRAAGGAGRAQRPERGEQGAAGPGPVPCERAALGPRDRPRWANPAPGAALPVGGCGARRGTGKAVGYSGCDSVADFWQEWKLQPKFRTHRLQICLCCVARAAAQL